MLVHILHMQLRLFAKKKKETENDVCLQFPISSLETSKKSLKIDPV